jgi:hypothetical protein
MSRMQADAVGRTQQQAPPGRGGRPAAGDLVTLIPGEVAVSRAELVCSDSPDWQYEVGVKPPACLAGPSPPPIAPPRPRHGVGRRSRSPTPPATPPRSRARRAGCRSGAAPTGPDGSPRSVLDGFPGGQELSARDEPVGVVIPGELGQGLLVGPELVCEGGEVLVVAGSRPPGLGEPRTGKRHDHQLSHKRLKMVALREDAPASMVGCFRAATIGRRLVHAGHKRLPADALNVIDPGLTRRPTAGHATSQQVRPSPPEPPPPRAVREDLLDRFPGAAIRIAGHVVGPTISPWWTRRPAIRGLVTMFRNDVASHRLPSASGCHTAPNRPGCRRRSPPFSRRQAASRISSASACSSRPVNR